MLTINLKHAAIVLILVVLAFVGGTFYGQADVGRYRIENGLMVDTKRGMVKPVGEILASNKPYDWQSLPIVGRSSFDWSKYPTVDK